MAIMPAEGTQAHIEGLQQLIRRYGPRPPVAVSPSLIANLRDNVVSDDYPLFFFAVGKLVIDAFQDDPELQHIIDWSLKTTDGGDVIGRILGSLIVKHKTLPTNSLVVFSYNSLGELGRTKTVYIS